MQRKSKKRIFIVIAVSGLLLFLYIIGALSPVERYLTDAVKSVISRSQNYGFSIKGYFTNREEKELLENEIADLRSQLNENLVDKSRLLILEEENYLFRESLGFLSRNEIKYQMANVLSRGGIGESLGRLETMVIDKGTRDGVKEGLAVVNSEGLVVGKINEVKEGISQILLTNNDNCLLAATILGRDKTSGIVHGDLGLTMKMEFIPQQIEINDNDIVITSGLEENIPRGLVVGVVKGVEKENNELWQTANIDPQYDKESLTMVSIIFP